MDYIKAEEPPREAQELVIVLRDGTKALGRYYGCMYHKKTDRGYIRVTGVVEYLPLPMTTAEREELPY